MHDECGEWDERHVNLIKMKCEISAYVTRRSYEGFAYGRGPERKHQHTNGVIRTSET
jgi:hypothetical protein